MAGVVKARIEGDSSGFRASVNSAMRSVNEFKGLASTVAPVVGGMLSVHGLVTLGKDAIEAGAHIYNLAQRLGVGTNTIQKFGYAAKITGADSEQLVKGLLKLQANITNGGIETDKYQLALSKLGLTTKDLVNVSPEEAILRLADAFSKTANRGEANAAIIALLGVRMSGLIQLLAGGRKALEEMFKDAPQMAEETVLAMKALDDELIRFKAEIMPGAAEATGFFADKLRSIVNIAQKGIAGMAMFKDIAAFVAHGKTLSEAFSLADELHSATTSGQADALFTNKVKPPRKGNFEEPDEKAEKPGKEAKEEKDNSGKVASELARLDEIQFQNRLKLMDAGQKIAAWKEKELALTKQIAAAEDDVGVSDEDFLQMQIERERTRGEILSLENKTDSKSRGGERFGGTQIYSSPLQLVGALSSAVFAQSKANPADQTSAQLASANSKLDKVVSNTERTAAALVNS